jgi:DNA (cytosine-5)-methyltransferase 1
MIKKLKFIDVFSGCGGLSYGLEMAGLECIAAIDFNVHAINTFNLNHKNKVGFQKDLNEFKPKDLKEEIETIKVDLIVGGPPCQGFSTARSQGGANFGKRLVNDPRRDLYLRFLEYVEYFSPEIFVMENVLGIKRAASGVYFTKIQERCRAIGYVVAPIEINCWEYGVPQKRVRQLFIGTKKGNPLFMPLTLKKTHFYKDGSSDPSLEPFVSTGEAIFDLPILKADSGKEISKYDLERRKKHLSKYGERYIINNMGASLVSELTWHVSRPHSERDLRDFERLKEGENSKNAIARGVKLETPYSMESFADKYKRQDGDDLCSTIVAHLQKDGLMFIHPKQKRSLTPREAARIQSFPDNFNFSGQRGNVYHQIGNAVPPLAGRAIGMAVQKYLKNHANFKKRPSFKSSNRKKAIKKLQNIIEMRNFEKSIQQISAAEFLEIWYLAHIIHPLLHPESAMDESGEIEYTSEEGKEHVFIPFYIRTGWPTQLVSIAKEACTRFKKGEINELEYYFNDTKQLEKLSKL